MSPPASSAEVDRLLAALREGDGGAFDRLLPVVYEELRALARAVRRGPSCETVNTTALVHEAYLRLAGGGGSSDFEGRSHFLAVAAKAMRHVLVDHARRQGAQKRGGGLARVELSETLADGGGAAPDAHVLALDRSLDQLAALDSRKARVVECRFFGEMSVDETAAALGVSAATVQRDWRLARAWLYRALSDPV
ncbi:sigma-70 family RNA polymerase sigma factor [Rubrivirga sp. S365]|uniref:Sigma-70 family RNA polymerase sigma factor n=1 Tax=Rubrivirga litoralis TaxID=3075598 RepID=A0ABU3BNU2_9BACT|nr:MULTISPECIES: sigma-70 family RNA polymerase sigma factor [unclassified Rubrivirga]MDT0630933.1 sigma-70 family RNA polymerase sigma factor [Rubrivirga sp. F394]MDT7856576.1 sigma-70 family RNA polymerase sigma factor [Rubrivirga sp. S365]